MHLYEAEKRIYKEKNPVHFFRKRLLHLFDDSAMLIWDLPPTLSLINDNVLCIADYIIIPTHTDYLSLTGIGNLLGYLKIFRETHGRPCPLLGVAVTLHRSHVRQNQQNLATLQETFPRRLFQNVIPLSTAIATTAQNHLTPLEAGERAGKAYEALVQEIHQRMHLQENHG